MDDSGFLGGCYPPSLVGLIVVIVFFSTYPAHLTHDLSRYWFCRSFSKKDIIFSLLLCPLFFYILL